MTNHPLFSVFKTTARPDFLLTFLRSPQSPTFYNSSSKPQHLSYLHSKLSSHITATPYFLHRHHPSLPLRLIHTAATAFISKTTYYHTPESTQYPIIHHPTHPVVTLHQQHQAELHFRPPQSFNRSSFTSSTIFKQYVDNPPHHHYITIQASLLFNCNQTNTSTPELDHTHYNQFKNSYDHIFQTTTPLISTSNHPLYTTTLRNKYTNVTFNLISTIQPRTNNSLPLTYQTPPAQHTIFQNPLLRLLTPERQSSLFKSP